MKNQFKKIAGRLILSGKLRGIVMDSLRRENLYLCGQFDGRIFALYPGDYIGECLLKDGQYQRELVKGSLEILKAERRLSGPLTILEIGANIGTQTNYFFDYVDVKQIVSVEPDPENAFLLDINVKLNGIADRVTIVAVAASHQAGLLDFAKFRYNSGRSAVVNASVYGGTFDSFKVQAERADKIVRDAGLTPRELDFIWIDVEEHEISVMKGMPEILKEGIPMVIEFSRHAMSDEDFKFFTEKVLPHYGRMRAYETGFNEVSVDELSKRTSQYNLLLS